MYYWDNDSYEFVTFDEDFTISTNREALEELASFDSPAYLAETPEGESWNTLDIVEVGKLYQ